jgi:predicted dehydrogenase
MSSWSSANPLRTAVIGVGYLGTFHAQKYQQLEKTLPVKLVAVSDAVEVNLSAKSQSLNVQGFLNFKDLLGKVDAVTIATTTSSHFEVAQFFLESKVHVNVEKPICVTPKEAEQLISLAEKNNLKLAVGHSERFSTVQKALKELVKNPLHIELERLAPFKGRGGDVSVMLDLAVHDIDLARDLLGSDFHWVSGRHGRVFSETGDWLTAKALGGKTTLQFHISRTAAEMSRKITVYETDKIIIADYQNLKLTINRRVNANQPLQTEIINIDKSDNLALETQVFLESVLFQKPLLVDGRAGLFALKMALAASELSS